MTPEKLKELYELMCETSRGFRRMLEAMPSDESSHRAKRRLTAAYEMLCEEVFYVEQEMRAAYVDKIFKEVDENDS